jgi:plasmid stabilization system protein ParE
VKVVWKSQALHDVNRLVGFLLPKNPTAAARAFKAIEDAALRLGEFPSIGRPLVDMPTGYRALLVPFSSSGYRILYLDADPIEILAVRHMREDQY